jgi:ribosome-binding protein aMBF1 (putative translation factor)
MRSAVAAHVPHLLPLLHFRAGTLSVDYGPSQRSRFRCPSVPDRRERTRDLEIAAAFGRRVREVRTAKGMTQEALAEAAGLHPTFVSNVERGYRVPTIPTLLRLANGLGVQACELLDDLSP